MFTYVPAGLRPGAPLVAVLHGCGQEAQRFAADAGWIALADRLGFPLVLPQQLPGNNIGTCFNWFQPVDNRRGNGEARSVREMVADAAWRFRSDPGRVFAAGFSAGGSLAAALLAAYPDVFAGGAVVAGLPVGSASSFPQALLRMAQAGPRRSAAAWAEEVRKVAPRGPAGAWSGRWPRLSVWRGLADSTVHPANAELMARQWAELHGVSGRKPVLTPLGSAGITHASWGGCVELWTVPWLDHGFPVAPGQTDGGRAGPWVTDAGIPAAWHIARFWRL